MKPVIWNFIKHGEIYMINFEMLYSNVVKGIHPAIIVQNNMGNRYSPCTSVIPSYEASDYNIWHVGLSAAETELNYSTIAYCDYCTTIDKHFIKYKLGELNQDAINKILNALMSLFNIPPLIQNITE